MDRRPPLDDEALLGGFESARLPAAAFGHAEHVRAAFLYLTRHPDFGEAAVLFRSALRRFAAAKGVPDRYHETLTWAYLALINERAHGSSFASSAGAGNAMSDFRCPRDSLNSTTPVAAL